MYLEENKDWTSSVFDGLSNEGFRPTKSELNELQVKVEGFLYTITFDRFDKGYVQVAMPGFWIEENQWWSQAMVMAANNANVNSKFAKIIVHDLKAHIVVQALEAGPDLVLAHFPRYISAIRYAAGLFASDMSDAKKLAAG